MSVSVRAECRLKDFNRGPTKSHSNNNTEKPETHLSQERDVKITVASDLNIPSLQASDVRPALHSTVQALQTVTGPSQHSQALQTVTVAVNSTILPRDPHFDSGHRLLAVINAVRKILITVNSI